MMKPGQIKKHINRVIKSSLHFAIASINEDGWPHLTPIGSFMLLNELQGIYFEKFTTNMPKNFSHSKKICILGVNSSRLFWFKSLFMGRFYDYPAIRIFGTVGKKRKATPEEIKKFEKRVGIALFFKGGQKLWRKMHFVREIQFQRVEPVKVGSMTAQLD